MRLDCESKYETNFFRLTQTAEQHNEKTTLHLSCLALGSCGAVDLLVKVIGAR
jgi:hypothetical protein